MDSKMRIQVGSLGKPNNKQDTVLEDKRKSLIQYCERSELCLHFGWTKVNQKWQNGQFWRVFENLSLWSNSATRQVSFKRTKIGEKIPKLNNSNETFWLLLKLFEHF